MYFMSRPVIDRVNHRWMQVIRLHQWAYSSTHEIQTMVLPSVKLNPIRESESHVKYRACHCVHPATQAEDYEPCKSFLGNCVYVHNGCLKLIKCFLSGSKTLCVKLSRESFLLQTPSKFIIQNSSEENCCQGSHLSLSGGAWDTWHTVKCMMHPLLLFPVLRIGHL